MPDREKVIKGLEQCIIGFDCPEECPYLLECNDLTKPMFVELANDVLALLKEQEAEIAFLKEMQLQTVHNMSNEDIGNAVRNVLRL